MQEYAEVYTSQGWLIDFYPRPLGSTLLQRDGTHPTNMFFDGEYVSVGPSPGLLGRNT